MRVLPILFNTDMVRAILDGRKTVTRRVVKPQLGKECPACEYVHNEYLYDINAQNIYCARCGEPLRPNKKAPFKPGDILYVRETWKCWRAHRYEATADIMFKAGGDGVQLQFANGNTDSVDCYDYDKFVNKWFSHYGKWTPSLHMPKEAARIFLTVKDVRVERLQKITEEQAICEGTKETFPPLAVDEFRDIWNSTIKNSDFGTYGWNANPWAWVIEFERCEKPEEW